MIQIHVSILTFLVVVFNSFSFGQKPCDIAFVDGKQYCQWKPSNSEKSFAIEQIKKKFISAIEFEIKKTISRLCYIDSSWGQVSTHLAISKIIDTTSPFKSFQKIFYSHSRDSVFLTEPYIFDPDSKKTDKIISAYKLKKANKINNNLYDSICHSEHIEMGKTFELLGTGTAFYSIDSYKTYSDKYVYLDKNGKEYIFISFYNPTPDFDKGLNDNFLLLYCVTDNKLIMNFPMFGEL